jgi:Lon protease-like protein
MDDGRYNLILEGQSRFKVLRELDVTTAFRQVEAELIDDDEDETLTHAQRGGFEAEARKFAARQGYSVDWESVVRLDDQTLINGVSQIAPFDPASKQALLEADNLSARCELLVQLMQFFGRSDGGEEIMTLQ